MKENKLSLKQKIWYGVGDLSGNIMYSARGPVCDIHDEEVIKDLVEGANALAKKYKAFVLRVEPDILKSDEEFRSIVSRNGFKIGIKFYYVFFVL